MTITADSPFRNIVRITRDRFIEVLTVMAALPVIQERDPGEYWDQIVADKLDPLFILAMFNHESSMGKAGVAVTTHSWGNTRRPNFGAEPIGDEPGRTGSFPIWRNWMDGLKSTTGRLNAPNWVYHGRTKIREIFDHPSGDVWAPAGDLNNPAGYLRAVLDFMNLYQNTDRNGETPVAKPKIALSAGHHNSDRGGTAGEYERTGPLTREIARRLREHGGFDVRVITPDDGMGNHPGSLYDAAREVVTWAGQGWTADLFLEVHFEGNGAGDAGRGSFAIYPDWGSDVDVDVRDRLGPSLALRLREATGVVLRGSGIMSEKSTGVGSQGHRLGVFRATEEVKATCTRMIYEFGALTSQADRALIDKPDYRQKAAGAVLSAVAAFYGVDDRQPQQPPSEPDDALYVPDNPFGRVPVVHGFKAMFERIGQANYPSDPIAGAVAVLGYPMGPEFETAEGSAQVFERAVLKWIRGADKPWDVVVALRSEGIPETKAA